MLLLKEALNTLRPRQPPGARPPVSCASGPGLWTPKLDSFRVYVFKGFRA